MTQSRGGPRSCPAPPLAPSERPPVCMTVLPQTSLLSSGLMCAACVEAHVLRRFFAFASLEYVLRIFHAPVHLLVASASPPREKKRTNPRYRPKERRHHYLDTHGRHALLDTLWSGVTIRTRPFCTLQGQLGYLPNERKVHRAL